MKSFDITINLEGCITFSIEAESAAEAEETANSVFDEMSDQEVVESLDCKIEVEEEDAVAE